MADEVKDQEAAAPPKKRALPFKRTVAREPKLSADAKTSEDNDLDFFRHTREVFPEILREAEEAQERKEQEHQQRPQNKRRKLSSSPSDSPPAAPPRSATLEASDDDDLIMDVKGKGKEILPARQLRTPVKPASTRPPPRTPGSSGTNRTTPASTSRVASNNAARPVVPIAIVDLDSDSDPEPAPIPAPSSPDLQEISPPSPDPAPAADDFSEWVAKARALQAAQETQDAIIKVMVTSPLASSAPPLIAKRRINQSVQLLLTVWVNRTRDAGIDIPEDVAAGLFLTWKGHKIYGHSTLASLGVEVDAQGEVRRGRGGAAEGYARDGILLEVWSEEAYEAFLAEKGKQRALEWGADEDDPVADSDGVPYEVEAEPEVPRKKGIKIVLKAKEHEPLKMTTRDDTTVEVLVEAFRTQREIEPEWEVAIWFDGERLDEDSLVTEIDVDPDDVNQLEVHIKKAA